MKKKLFILAVLLCSCFALKAQKTPNPDFDFSAVCSTGQTLYYRIIDAEQNLVSIVAPNGDNVNGWNGYNKPAGDITLPETVEYDGTSYTVRAIGDQSFNSCFGLTGSLVIPNSVTSIGNDAFFRCSGFSSLTIGNSVTSIGADAFWECSGLTGSLTIPNSVESIGEYAFMDLGYDGTLTIGSSVTSIGVRAFAYSKFAHIISKPTTPPALGNYAFSDMTELLSITVPCGKDDDYKTATGWSSFASMIEEDFMYGLTVASANTEFGTASITQQATCENPQATVSATRNTGYKFIYWTENGEVVSYNNPYTFTLTTDRNLVANFSKQYDFSAACTTGQTLYYRIIDAEKHWVSIVAPNNDTWDYGWNGFIKPTGNITLPETVTHNDISYTVKEIGICAFSLCDGLTGSLSIPNSVTSIGEQAFNHCSGFTGSLTIPNSVTSIGMAAFWNCYGFTGSLTIPNSVTSIRMGAFYNCSGFTGSLIIGNSVTNIGENAFESCSNFTGSLNIPNSVTSIGGSAFYGCSGFTGSLIIPNSVASIGQSAFQNCSGFTGSLTIPNSVTSIGQSAFQNCSGFTGSLTIGSSVTSIGDNAFRSCSRFTNIIAKPATPPTLGNNAFSNMSNLQTITVPCGNYEDYDITWWISFGDIMVKDFVYDLTVASANNGFGSANITQQPDCDTEAKVTATPNDGYKFVNWTENGEVVSTENPYTFTMTTDRNLEANFTTIGYHFNGTTGSEWNTAANWEENEVPAPNSPIVFINANCQVNTDAEVGAVTVAADKTLTIAEGKTLTADLITLEDGAQLVNNGTVACNDLTVKKDIEGYGTDGGNWYLVSSPVATTSLPVGMITDPAENYDLYRFSQTGDEEGREWLNYKAESFGIENQNGYLYACKNDTTIIFHGDLAATGTKELEYDEGEGVDFPGFNLVGNPYPCNATISGTNLRSSNYYYKMNAAGTDLEVVAEPILAPCTGVFAVAANSNATVTFTQADATSNVTRGEKSSLQDIRVELLANGKVIDRAILNMNGESLPKFRLQDNGSEICFYQNKEELAVVSTDATRGEMPLNFKAAKNGSYTITVNVENADMNYLHLIDNLTGENTDLLATPSYSFEAKTNDYASRFKLVFGVKDTELAEVTDTFAFISNGEIIVSNEGRATLQVIDVLGRIVSSEEINGECRISTNGLTAGVYILNLNGKTQKIVVE